MKPSNKILVALAAASALTVTVRLTVFGDDCNLIVVGMTFLLSFALCCLIWRLLDLFRQRHNKRLPS